MADFVKVADMTTEEREALIVKLRDKVDKERLNAYYRVAESTKDEADTRSLDEIVDGILLYDWEVEHAPAKEKLEFDLSDEKAKVAKSMNKMGVRKAPVAYNFNKRERKANPTKGAIIAELAKFLTEQSENACESVEITNKERQIAFKIGENAFELTLVQKRKPKN